LKILFVHQGLMSFVQKDLDILQSRYEVRALHFAGAHNVAEILSGTLWADLTMCWFGKLHAFLAVASSKILGRKAVVVAGGDDVACQSEINYGMFVYWWKKWCPLYVFQHADLVLSVSGFNRCETIQNTRADPSKVSLLYHGFDPQKWQHMDGVRKEKLVLTVGRVTNETLRKKGLDLFVQSARHLPDVPFVLVGPWQDSAVERLKTIAPSNVTFAGGLYGRDLLSMYSRATVYVQASVHESFGCSVAEAMLCECVPVVSRRAALPEVVGDCGLYIDELEPRNLAAQIGQALRSQLGQQARERVIATFPLERRHRLLLALVDEAVAA